jgi:hypothetical protein
LFLVVANGERQLLLSAQTKIMKRLLALILVLFFSSQLQAAPPNVLFIAMDDLNDWVGCLG